MKHDGQIQQFILGAKQRDLILAGQPGFRALTNLFIPRAAAFRSAVGGKNVLGRQAQRLQKRLAGFSAQLFQQCAGKILGRGHFRFMPGGQALAELPRIGMGIGIAAVDVRAGAGIVKETAGPAGAAGTHLIGGNVLPQRRQRFAHLLLFDLLILHLKANLLLGRKALRNGAVHQQTIGTAVPLAGRKKDLSLQTAVDFLHLRQIHFLRETETGFACLCQRKSRAQQAENHQAHPNPLEGFHLASSFSFLANP